MLNFLRKLRRDNMTGKYFKYAIGEVFLVVLGILIALSLNNWNTNRVNNQKKDTLLKSLQSEFTLNDHDFSKKFIRLGTTGKFYIPSIPIGKYRTD